MKYKNILIGLIIILLSGALVWNKVQFNKHIKTYNNQVYKNIRDRRLIEQTKDALIKSQIVAMKHLGKKIILENIKKFNSNDTMNIINKSKLKKYWDKGN